MLQKCTSLTLCAAGKTVQTWMKYSQTANSEAQFILSSHLGWPSLSFKLGYTFDQVVCEIQARNILQKADATV